MLFFKPLRYFNLRKVNGPGKIEFNKGEVYFIEQLRNGNLDTHCNNNDVSAKAKFLEGDHWIEESADAPCDLNTIIQTLILARMDNV